MAFGRLFDEPTAQTYLDAAISTADWLADIAIKTQSGTTWPRQSNEATDDKEFMGELSLYSGSTGIIFFLLQIGSFLHEDKYLNLAIDGGRYIVSKWEQERDKALLFAIPNTQWGFANGGAGIAFVLNELGKITGKAVFTETASKLAEDVVTAAFTSEAGAYWSGQAGVVSDSGIVLFLLYAAKEFKNAAFLPLAVSAGKRLLGQGQKQENGGIVYQGLDTSRVGMPTELQFPNFELGTAGIAYTLARLYEESGRQEFLQGAEGGAAYIRSIAAVSDDAALIPYRLPSEDEVFYLGYCHGPAGTGRLFYLLHKLTGNELYKEWTKKLANGIVRAGAPEQHSNGYWNVVSQCCGTSAILHFFLGLWASTNDPGYISVARRSADHILHEAVSADAGIRWFQAWTRVVPWHVTADTGYFSGAAGVGAALLEFYQAKTGRYSVIRMVDDPFPLTSDQSCKKPDGSH